MSQTQDNEPPTTKRCHYGYQYIRQRRWEHSSNKNQPVARKIQFDNCTNPEPTKPNKDKPLCKKDGKKGRSSTEINASQPPGYPKIQPTLEGEDSRAKKKKTSQYT